MKVNLDQKITLLNGSVLQNEDNSPMTIRAAIVQALNAADTNPSTTGDEKFQRFILATKVHNGKVNELTVEELSIIKKRVGEVYAMPEVIGAIYNAIEEK